MNNILLNLYVFGLEFDRPEVTLYRTLSLLTNSLALAVLLCIVYSLLLSALLISLLLYCDSYYLRLSQHDPALTGVRKK